MLKILWSQCKPKEKFLPQQNYFIGTKQPRYHWLSLKWPTSCDSVKKENKPSSVTFRKLLKFQRNWPRVDIQLILVFESGMFQETCKAQICFVLQLDFWKHLELTCTWVVTYLWVLLWPSVLRFPPPQPPHCVIIPFLLFFGLFFFFYLWIRKTATWIWTSWLFRCSSQYPTNHHHL